MLAVLRPPSRWAIGGRAAIKSHAAENLFANASFEDGRDLWQLDHAGKTTATFSVDDKDAAAGQRSAVLSVGTAEEWGIQFGQTMEAPARARPTPSRCWPRARNGRRRFAWRSNAAAAPTTVPRPARHRPSPRSVD